jgi:hypothetical protein
VLRVEWLASSKVPMQEQKTSTGVSGLEGGVNRGEGEESRRVIK